MSSAASLWQSFVIMIVCVFASLLLIFALAPAENMITQIQSTGLLDVPEVWQTADDQDFYVSIAYWLTYFLSFFGVGQFVWTAVRRQRYDIYGNEVNE